MLNLNLIHKPSNMFKFIEIENRYGEENHYIVSGYNAGVLEYRYDFETLEEAERGAEEYFNR